jgi:hypothetical protein
LENYPEKDILLSRIVHIIINLALASIPYFLVYIIAVNTGWMVFSTFGLILPFLAISHGWSNGPYLLPRIYKFLGKTPPGA